MSIVFRQWPAVALVALLVPGVKVPPPATTAPDVAVRAGITAQYGDLPLAFEINRGQVDAPVRFMARGAGYSLFLTPTQAVLALRPGSHPAGALEAIPPRRMADANAAHTAPAIVSLTLAGANQEPVVEGLDPQPGK